MLICSGRGLTSMITNYNTHMTDKQHGPVPAGELLRLWEPVASKTKERAAFELMELFQQKARDRRALRVTLEELNANRRRPLRVAAFKNQRGVVNRRVKNYYREYDKDRKNAPLVWELDYDTD